MLVPRKRSGFSLVELLVVIAIIGILLALLLPAVIKARSSARSTVCRNNMRQIGVALHSYHDLQNEFPPAAIWAEPPGETLDSGRWAVGILDRIGLGLAPNSEPARMMGNWALMLLPHLDQNSLYDVYDWEKPVSDPANEVVRTTRVAVYRCPADAFNTAENMFDRGAISSQPGNFYARGNYAYNMGPNRGCFRHKVGGEVEWPVGNRDNATCDDGFWVDGERIFEDNTQLWGNGIGGVNKSFGFAHVKSGATNFIAVDEIRAGVNKFDSRGSWALGFIGASITARHGIVGYQEDGSGPNNQDTDSDDIFGCSAVHQESGSDFLTETGMPCFSSSQVDNEVNFQQTARSMHLNGVFALRLDGSVKFISDNILPAVWSKLHNRTNTEQIGEDLY